MSSHVNVRSYNVGFGDCFLLAFPGPERSHRMLIDCGSIKGGEAGSIDDVVAQLIADITDEDGVARLDVVAMSHRHKDHVSGFASELWASVEVGEVWLPWTEDPEDPTARAVLHRQSAFALALDHSLAGIRVRQQLDATSVDAIELAALNAMTNQKAMDTLHAGFKGPRKKRYVSRELGTIETKSLPGVTVHVLGPAKSEDVIREMNPPKEESFFRAAVEEGVVDLAVAMPPSGLPFAAYELADEELARYDGLVPDEDLVELLSMMSDEGALFAAVALDKAVNNTSLMLLFEVGDAYLLFPGDSQWGTWDLNMKDADMRRLMGRTTFYKIGHHGSHNATPVTFVEEILGTNFWAAASVVPHGRFKEIPKAELLEELAEHNADHNRVLRSDKPPEGQVEGVTVNGIESIDVAVPI